MSGLVKGARRVFDAVRWTVFGLALVVWVSAMAGALGYNLVLLAGA